MSLVVGGVRLDKLLALEPGTVIDAVPSSEQSYFFYWRGLHLGKIALNLLRRRMFINAGENDRMIHFTDEAQTAGRPYVQGVAGRIATTSTESTTRQWHGARDSARFTELTGLPVPRQFAGAVIATRYVGPWATAKEDSYGNIATEAVGFHEIDPHSLAAFEDLFEVDLLADPAGLDAAVPLTPAPAREPEVLRSNPTWRANYWDISCMPGTRPYDAPLN